MATKFSTARDNPANFSSSRMRSIMRSFSCLMTHPRSSTKLVSGYPGGTDLSSRYFMGKRTGVVMMKSKGCSMVTKMVRVVVAY